ncbi:MAG: hypothetical protein Q7J34_02875 [Bacteroidales bacterium]|nr:hypothetical protein [Bacteroidales bacterium]
MKISQEENSVLIIAGNDLPAEADQILQSYGELIRFNASPMAYPPIGSHPDVFLCNTGRYVVYAPGTPAYVLNAISDYGFPLKIGKRSLGNQYPSTAAYNCVITNDFLIHKEGCTDKSILEDCQSLQFVSVNQAYTRCSLLALNERNFITSDRRIEKVLKALQCEVLYLPSDDVVLPDYPHGFIGGCMGILGNRIFTTGSFNGIKDGYLARAFIKDRGFELIELTKGSMIDVGGIFFFTRRVSGK